MLGPFQGASRHWKELFPADRDWSRGLAQIAAARAKNCHQLSALVTVWGSDSRVALKSRDKNRDPIFCFNSAVA